MIRATNKTTTVYAPIQISRLLLILLLAQMPFTAIAQDGLTDVDLYPLRPADLSSPRDTLKGFLKNMNEAIADWRKRGGDSSSAGFRSYERATQTLDFSAMPDSNSALVRRERSLFLKELLDRIELPPDHEIPGDAQVTDNALTRWAIPDTQITIRRIDDGPRAGEFLFSADTVLQLDRLYRQARHLAYHPGATAGIYEEYMRSPYTVAAMEARVRNRLMPVDTSSPRSTLEGFLDSVNRTYTLAKEAEAALQATPPTMSKKEAREVETKAANLLRLA